MICRRYGAFLVGGPDASSVIVVVIVIVGEGEGTTPPQGRGGGHIRRGPRKERGKTTMSSPITTMVAMPYCDDNDDDGITVWHTGRSPSICWRCARCNTQLRHLGGASRGAVFRGASVVKRRASSGAGGRPWACRRGSRSWPSIGRASCWTRGSEFVWILDVAMTTMRTAMTMAAGT